MSRFLFAAAILLAVPQEKPLDGAKAAKDLLDRVEAKLKSAKTLRFGFKITMEGGPRMMGPEGELASADFLMRNPGEIRMSVRTPRGGVTARSDGRIVVLEGESEAVGTIPDQPKELAEFAQKVLLNGFMTLQGTGVGLDPTGPTTFFLGGREKVGEVETQLISYDLKTTMEELDRITVRAWIDPVKLVVVKREYDLRAFCRVIETLTTVALDEALPADEFALQSARALRAALEEQIARSVELYAVYMGRLPDSLADLDAAPKAGGWWPEGGFWIGGTRPADVKYAVAGGVATIGSKTVALPVGGRIAPPSERLKQYYASRIRLQLVSHAIGAFHKAYIRIPQKFEDLTAKPEGIDFWPEGGFLRADRLKDAWGDVLVLKADREDATVICARRKENTMTAKKLAPEETKGLKENAYAPLAGEAKRALDAALNRLADGTIEEREAATKEILAMGPPVLETVEAKLAAAGSAELKIIRERLQATPPSWRTELRPLVASYRAIAAGAGSPKDNERRALMMLKVITTAQADFRSNDRDGNRTMDFWVRDVAGLYGIVGATGSETECKPGGEGATDIIKLLEPSMAAADATEGRWEYPVLGVSEPEPYHGYFVAALKNEQQAEVQPYHKGDGRNTDLFGFIAYPAEYGVTGRLAFIVNADNTVWCQDLKGETVDTFPSAPAAEGWKKAD